MRTKVLLCAAALAASLASSMAQNVYSLNVVGYVNVTIPGGGRTSLIANPLDATGGGATAGMNNITNLFQGMAQGTTIQVYDTSLQDFTISSIFNTRGGWTVPVDVPPGKSVFFTSAVTSPDVAVTYVGQVVQGTYNVATIPAFKNATVGAPVPIGGDITNATTFVGVVPYQGDAVQTFNSFASASGDWNPSANWNTRGGWSPVNGTNLWINPGQGFLYYNANPTTPQTWVSNFTVQ